MEKSIVINVSMHETRIAIVEDRTLVELYYEMPEGGRMVGDIHYATVAKVVKELQAAFIDSTIVDFMNAPAFHSITVMVFFSGNIFIIIGLIVLNFQRVEFDLSAAMAEVKTLRGIIPICSSCKKIRDDQGIWNQIEEYIRDHSEADFTHSICPECMKKLYPEFVEKINNPADPANSTDAKSRTVD